MKKLIMFFTVVLLFVFNCNVLAQTWTDDESANGKVTRVKKGTKSAQLVKSVGDPEDPALVSSIPGFRDTIITANIALGDSCTQTLNLGNRRLKTIYMPAAWDAANLTVRVSPDNVTWYNYYSDDVELTIVAGASYAINVNPRVFIGIQYIQLRSGTSAADVDQTAARILKLKIGNY